MKFHTPNRPVTVLLLLPYCLEASICAGILEDWLAFKAEKEQRLQCQLKSGQGKRKTYRPIQKEGLVVDRVTIISPEGVAREKKSTTPLVSLTRQDEQFIYQRKLVTTR